MALAAGDRLGAYEVVSLLGVGGMGEVYRARDPRLGRDVAIKVLPAAVAADPERLARFEQEARATAALNHPNILAVYDIGNADGVVYVVSELLDGETLRDTLTHGPVATRQAVDHAVQIAHGLAAAHEKGIVHRDLKPENVFVTRDGRVKILDFGLAKLIQPSSAFSGTMMQTTPAGTAAGMIVGTIGYMAPEQIRGQAVDHRADIFAFGAILYELLTGERAFAGESPADTISAILKEDPPQLANAAKVGTPALQRIVQRCLEKKPELRFHSAHDLAYAIEASTQPGSGILAAAAPIGNARRSLASAPWIGLAVAALVAIGSSVVAIRHLVEPAPRPPVTRLTLTLPPGTVLATGPGGGMLFSVSPDGRFVVAALRAADAVRLWVRPLDAFEFRPLRGTEGVTGQPFWSPDGRFIAFSVGSAFKRVAVADGAVDSPFTLGEGFKGVGFGGGVGSWSPDGILLLDRGQGRAVAQVGWIAAGSGSAVPLKVDLPPDASIAAADSLSGGRVLYTLLGSNGRSLAMGAIGSSTVRPIGPIGGAPQIANGFVIFVRNASLVAQRFDETSARLVGEPVTVNDDVMAQVGIGFLSGRTAFSASRANGTVVFLTGQGAATQLTWVDRDGRPGQTVGAPGNFSTVALSRDGTRVAYGRIDPNTARNILWISDIGRNVSSRFSSGSYAESDPAWSPDGNAIAFTSSRSDGKTIFQKPSAGGSESMVLHLEQVGHGLDDWSRDGRFLLYHVTDEERAIPLSGDRTPVTVLSGLTRPDEAAFSPDGRLVALNADDSGRTEVYLTTFPPTGQRWQVSDSGGAQPRWRGDGRELYYLALDGTMMAVAVGSGSKPDMSAPRKLFSTRISVRTDQEQYAVRADGQRFLIMAPPENSLTELRVILNWPSLLPAK